MAGVENVGDGPDEAVDEVEADLGVHDDEFMDAIEAAWDRDERLLAALEASTDNTVDGAIAAAVQFAHEEEAKSGRRGPTRPA